jgi:transcriptional regulator with XRE-family HTH domain
LRDLAAEVGVGFTYLSRIENERLNYGDYPSDALDADDFQRPDVFAACDDKTLDKLMT